jgi:hypothetical protein
MKGIDYLVLGIAALILLTVLLLTNFTSIGPYWFPGEWFD